ncbi:MAG: hypothetical protein WCD43_06810, partial [Candidatus Acidiferrales bacterium]
PYGRCITDARWRSAYSKRKPQLEMWELLNAEGKRQGRGDAALSWDKRITKSWGCSATARRGFAHSVGTDCSPFQTGKIQVGHRFVEQLSLVYMMTARIIHGEPGSVIRAILAVGHIAMRIVMMTRQVRMRVALGCGVAM